ncbi:serine hydrolase domain-containing protein [Azospirillum doebereinerae]|uniref:Class A beta-lactamase-related serine hydrolase n=1 Tax=Azospirillum doebereinerae TaxID=92933 RepID=A0A433J9G8_9PROT|nr:serine hydrolase domain-containing protein [Azospirillum doebereinerae]RUQ71428.1 class A beta-lactamase-related serine hydrolase [Azospirillum doebereinerae]
MGWSAWTRASGRRVALLCLLAGAPGAVAAEETTGAALAGLLRRYDAPGGVLALSGPDGILRIAAAGLADRARGIPVTPDTRFHIASTGKMMTAVAVMQLVQAGRLALSDPALPLVDLPGAERLANLGTATVADLLSHRSGIPDCLRNAAASSARHPSPRWTVAEALTEAPCGPPTKPGAYVYSNTNYMLLGRIVERMDGTGLAEALEARIFRPAGMTATSLGADPADPAVAHGYRAPKPDGSRADASLYAYSSPLGDAPVTTTAGDLERFMTALFRRSGLLLDPALLREMLVDRAGDAEDGYGYGIMVEDSDFGPKHGHPGRLAGFRTEAWYYPERDSVVILIMNGDENTDDDVGLLLARKLLAP